jgi:ParB-like chromosome segregation protein Spo0J
MPRTYKIHKAALAFPRMPQPEFEELKEDIKQHGIRIPLLLNKKKDTILDGISRIRAAHDLGLKDSDIPIEVFDGNDGDEVSAIISRNIMRRHLTDDQRVSLVAKLRGDSESKDADARMKSGNPVSKSAQGRTHEKIAADAKVGAHKARAALLVSEHAPKNLDRVIAGKEKLSSAHKTARAKAGKTAKPKPQKSLLERVEAKFLKFMESFAVTEYAKVREILRDLLAKAGT